MKLSPIHPDPVTAEVNCATMGHHTEEKKKEKPPPPASPIIIIRMKDIVDVVMAEHGRAGPLDHQSAF